MKLKSILNIIYSDLGIRLIDENLRTIYIGYSWNIPDSLYDLKLRWIDVINYDKKVLTISIEGNGKLKDVNYYDEEYIKDKGGVNYE